MPDFSDYAKSSDSERAPFVYFHTAYRRILSADMQQGQTENGSLWLPFSRKQRHLLWQ